MALTTCWGFRSVQSEGAKFWLGAMNELKNRGVQDCFIACVDGLQGLPEAIETVFPKTQVQLCIVHKVRNSLKYVPWKERRAVAADLRAIYGATTLAAAEQALERFAARELIRALIVDPNSGTLKALRKELEGKKVLLTESTIASLVDELLT